MSELFKVAIERENPPRNKKNFHAIDKKNHFWKKLYFA